MRTAWKPHCLATALAGALLSAGLARSESTIVEKDMDDIPGNELILENAFIRAVVYPANGGAIGGLTDKRIGKTFADADLPLFSDKLWDQGWESDWSGKPYRYAIDSRAAEAVSVSLWRTGVTGNNVFLTLKKTFTLQHDAAALDARYEVHNAQEAMQDQVVKLWLHNGAWLGDEGGRYYAPCESGIKVETREFGKPWHHVWHRDPARGWTGFLSASGAGLVFEVEYRYLQLYYAWLGETKATLEWRYLGQNIPAGESWVTTVRVMPVSGLPTLSGAGGGLAGAIAAAPVTAEGAIPLVARVVSSRARAVAGRFQTRPAGAAGQPWQGVGPDMPLTLSPTGLPAVWRTAWTPPAAGGAWAARALVLADNDTDETPACRLDLTAPVGAAAAGASLPIENDGDRVGVREEAREPEHFLSGDVETPHFPWARPYCSGALKALLLTSYQGEREAVELAQRLELDWEHAFAEKDAFGMTQLEKWGWSGKTLDAEVTRKLAGDCEVIVLAGVPWDDLSPANRQAILDKVRAGCGLVYVQPRRVPEALAEFLPLPPAADAKERGGRVARNDDAHYLTGALPWQAMPPFAHFAYTTRPGVTPLLTVGEDPLLTVSTLGQGRVAALLWNTLWRHRRTQADEHSGLTPNTGVSTDTTFPYWEYFYALIARTVVWTARREAPISVQEVALRDTFLAVKLTAISPFQGLVRVTLRDRHGKTLNELHASVAATAGTAAITSEIAFSLPPDTPGGTLLADVQVLDETGVLAWGAAALEHRLDARIASLKLSPPAVQRAGETVHAAIQLEGARAGATLRVDLRDGYGRLVERQETAAAQPTVTVELDTSRCLRWRQTVTAFLEKDSVVLDEAAADFVIRPDPSDDRFVHLMWWEPGITREHLLPHLSERLQTIGVNAGMPYFNYKIPEARWLLDNGYLVFANNVYRLGYGYGNTTFARMQSEYAKTHDTKWLIQDPPLADAESQAQRRAGLEKWLQRSLPVVYHGWCIGDETSLTLHSTQLDVCWHPQTLTAMREWLKTEYADLAALNRQWETDFAAWDDVVPMTTEQVLERGTRNYSPWSDHRTFMEKVFSDTLLAARAALRQTAPYSRFGVSGTDWPQPYNGLDWWRLREAYDFVFTYGTADLHLSFNPDVLCSRWSGYWQSGPQFRHVLWGSIFTGRGMLANWWTPCFVFPDLTLTPTGRDAAAYLTPVHAGIGEILTHARRAGDRVAVYYSQRSVHGSFISDPNRFALYKSGHVNQYVAALRDLGLGSDYVSYEQVAAGELGRRGYAFLLMPHVIALSDAEAQAIRAWVKDGGVVVADAKIGLLDGHCRGLDQGQLDDLFGITGQSYLHAQPKGEILLAETAPAAGASLGDLEIKRLPAQIVEDDLRLTTGKALAAGAAPEPLAHGPLRIAFPEQSARPAVILNSVGRGKAVYLNFFFSDYTARRSLGGHQGLRELMRALLQLADIVPKQVVLAAGEPAADVTTYAFVEGDIRYLGLLRDPVNTAAGKKDPANGATEANYTLRLEKHHVYDVNRGAYLGHTDAVDLSLEPGEGRLLALTATRLAPLTLDLPAQARQGGRIHAVIGGGETDHLRFARIRVSDPAGHSVKWFRAIVPVRSQAEIVRSLPLDAPAGAWRLTVTDVVSGNTIAHTLTVE